MITQKQLLFEPENFEPLGSVKSVLNYPSFPSFVNVDIVELFLSTPNMQLMSESLYKIHRQNGGTTTLHKMSALTPLLAQKFVKRNDIKQYIPVDIEATEQIDWVEILKTVNNNFAKFCYDYMSWNAFNPYRSWIECGPTEDRKQKRMQDLTAADIPTLDLWRTQEVQRINSAFRFNNSIPFWQYTMNTRFYDKSNEGLRNDTADRASLDVPIYGYDMSEIHNLTDKWMKEEWFGI
jgi:hypothetical protein